MISELFEAFFYIPLYNGLIFLMDTIPWADAGVAVILFTCIVKLILFPLSRKSIEVQMNMRAIQTDLDQIKIKYKDNREEQAKQTMALYKTKGINPFIGILLVIIQIPIIIALYLVFYKGGLPAVDHNLLYSFVKIPESINMNFLGLIDISQKSFVAALFAAVSQFFQIRFSMPIIPSKSKEPSFKNDLARSLSLQMRYVMPIFIFFFAWQLAAVVSLYWTTSNLFAIGQELYIRKKFKNYRQSI